MINYKKESTKREHQIADSLQGRRQSGSGSIWSSKGDVETSTFLVEDKYTKSSSYSLSLKSLLKIEKEASKYLKLPLFRIGFSPTKHNFVIIRYEDWPMEQADCPIILQGKKSLSLKKDFLLQGYLNTTFFILLLLFESRKYYLIHWNDFLERKDNFL